MDQPGVWVLGELDDTMRKSGMGMIVECANQSGVAQWKAPDAVDFRYEILGRKTPEGAATEAEEVSIPLPFRPKFEGYGDFDHCTINGLSRPKSREIQLTQGTRYRLIFDNRSTDIHPVRLHRHTLELKSMNGRPTSGMEKMLFYWPLASKRR